MYKFDLSLFLIVDSPNENKEETELPDGKDPTQTFGTVVTPTTLMLNPSSLMDITLL